MRSLTHPLQLVSMCHFSQANFCSFAYEEKLFKDDSPGDGSDDEDEDIPTPTTLKRGKSSTTSTGDKKSKGGAKDKVSKKSNSKKRSLSDPEDTLPRKRKKTLHNPSSQPLVEKVSLNHFLQALLTAAPENTKNTCCFFRQQPEHHQNHQTSRTQHRRCI